MEPMGNLKEILMLIILVGCNPKEEIPVTYTKNIMEPGDLVVTNGGANGNKSVVLLDSEGNFKRTLLDLSQAESPMDLAFDTIAQELLITIDGLPDRVMSISAYNGSKANQIDDSLNLTGTLYGIGILPNGDVIISEGSAIERYNSNGVRVVANGWPKTALMTSMNQISVLPSGNFLTCASTTDQARIYNDSGTQLFTTTTSGVAATTDLFGCIVLQDGSIALAWNGTTDTIQIRTSNLATTSYSYSNTTVLPNPRGMAQRANGNILIVDQTNNYLVEIDIQGNLVGIIGENINSPVSVFVIPDF
jgi:hypothetical protein